MLKLKNDEIDEIEIPENPKPNKSLFICFLFVCAYTNLQSKNVCFEEMGKFFSSHRLRDSRVPADIS